MFNSNITEKITAEHVTDLENAAYDTFDDFKENTFKIWKITFPQIISDWKDASCTCSSFDTKYMCKHIIKIAHSLGIIETSDQSFDDNPLFAATRGRPRKATPALQKD